MDKLIIEKKPRSPISEAYRTIRTNIDFSSVDNDVRRILITSPGLDEGKSITAGNLALAYAQAGKRTLLIDGDLRKPTVFKLFNLSNRLGLSNVIVDGVKVFDAKSIDVDGLGLNDIIRPYNEKLDVLVSGTVPPNPSEIIGSKKMRVFLDSLSARYDMIIIDTPPVNAVTDAQLFSTMVDGVVFVVVSEITHIDSAKRARDLLEQVNAKILGVVLTRVKVEKSKYGYSGYYAYYGAEGKKSKRSK